jgi:hypothetical protein
MKKKIRPGPAIIRVPTGFVAASSLIDLSHQQSLTDLIFLGPVGQAVILVLVIQI